MFSLGVKSVFSPPNKTLGLRPTLDGFYDQAVHVVCSAARCFIFILGWLLSLHRLSRALSAGPARPLPAAGLLVEAGGGSSAFPKVRECVVTRASWMFRSQSKVFHLQRFYRSALLQHLLPRWAGRWSGRAVACRSACSICYPPCVLFSLFLEEEVLVLWSPERSLLSHWILVKHTGLHQFLTPQFSIQGAIVDIWRETNVQDLSASPINT